MRQARLILEDGTTFCGRSFGFDAPTTGEVVFNTAMSGYPESLTDPSYAGQILVTTFPLIGNYGVPDTGVGADGLPLFMESDRIHAKALIVADYSEQYSHWNARESLASWLKREKVPGITGIDTRRLTKVLREHGVMMGRIEIDGSVCRCATATNTTEDYGSVNWVEQVSCQEVITYRPEANRSPLTSHLSPLKRVVLVDCGVKANIIRCLIRRGIEVVRVPWDYDFNQLEFDGLFLANGPGDPEQCGKTVDNIRTFLDNEKKKADGRNNGRNNDRNEGRNDGKNDGRNNDKADGKTVGNNRATVRPLMGICLGNQLLARAAGAKTYKLKYGHRSHNQPVREVGTERCYITSQNHGYAVDDSTLPEDWEPLFVNMNDGSNEGIRHKTNPWMSAQFHPEACSGPTDTEWMFDEFVEMLERNR